MRTDLYLKVIFLWVAFTCQSVMGQGIENLSRPGFNGAYVKNITKERKPAPLPGVRESDVLWSKTVWRMIDLREKVNQPLYFPVDDRKQGNLNLINLLLKAIENQQILAYDPLSPVGDEFSLPFDFKKVQEKMGAATKRTNVTGGDGIQRDTTYEVGMATKEVKKIKVKEIWYFDKQKSSLQVRIVGLCPIRVMTSPDEGRTEKDFDMFWVFYPDIRSILAKSEILNSYNGSQNLSMDDLFLMRKFDGYIIREENVYGNRDILEYAKGEYASKESERIKKAIFDYEQDLWEY